MLLHVAGLTAPLFLLVLVGAVLSRLGWPRTASDALTRFVFTVAVPTLLFRLMSDFGRLPRVAAVSMPVILMLVGNGSAQ